MTHYFSKDNQTLKSNPQVIAFSVNNTPLKFNTDHGVFSKDNFDRGTEVLLHFLEVKPFVKTALDLGCGYGVVGVYLNKVYNVDIDMVDVNNRAIALAKSNIILNGCEGTVFESDGLNSVTKKYDLIVTNPPIRAGKEVVYRFFEDAALHLEEQGEFYTVINKKHGAESAIRKLQTIYSIVEIVGKKKGFHTIMCKNRLTN